MATTYMHTDPASSEALRLDPASLKCPRCGAALPSIEEAMGRLRAECNRLAADLEYWNAGPFVASKCRKRFHRPTCKWMDYVPEGRLLEFSSHEEAVAAGLKPCGTCCS
jgi:hypothetical protein